MVEKLSYEELILLIKDLEAMKYSKGVEFGDHETQFIAQRFADPAFLKGLIIFVIICLMVLIVLIISLPFYFNLKKTKSFHKMISAFTEQGKEWFQAPERVDIEHSPSGINALPGTP